MQVKAHAKINLGLWVLDSRPDGFHNLLTVFHRIHLADEIDIESTDGAIRLTSDCSDVPLDEGNLCWKAASELRLATRSGLGAAIHVRKQIPLGAGLGGGSSDAAAVLLALRSLWNLTLTDEQLRSVALRVGSDVPYFLRRGSAVAAGRGDELQYIDLRLPYWIVVVTPPIHISTKWAYEALSDRRTSQGGVPPPPHSAPAHAPFEPANWMHNDFEELAFAAHPEIRELKRSLLEAGASFALMSGSGSSVFGLFSMEQNATSAARSLGSDMSVSVTEPNFSLA